MEMEPQSIQAMQLFFSPEKIKRIEQQLAQNKKQMIKILKQSPEVGVYRNEDPKIFYNSFFQFFIDFLKAEIGPRGDCSRAVRIELAKDPQFYDEVLKPLNLTHLNHIRDMWVRYKAYSPCKQYNDFLKLQQTIQKAQDAYNKICDENSIMFKNIRDGMIAKRGPEYDYQTQIAKIKQNYEVKLSNLKQKQKQLLEFLDGNENYHKYMKIKQNMKKFFDMWKEADMRIGLQSVSKGSTFQAKVKRQILPIILKRSKIQYIEGKVQILTNCRWNPKNLGQIDIAIAQYDQNDLKWKITVLIECKSKLFDIREAYKQVAVLQGPDFKKDRLCTKLGILQVIDKPLYFLVTTLPQNPFNLPIQSKLKESLEKASRNLTVDDIKPENLFKYAKQKFQQEISPLEWMNLYDSDQVIVLKPEIEAVK